METSLIVGALLGAVMLGFLLFIRLQDLPTPEPVSPFKHLDERKAAIYENLRDLQFEYRVNKLSDEDYQATKVGLQKELARVMAEVDRIKAEIGSGAVPEPGPAPMLDEPKPATTSSVLFVQREIVQREVRVVVTGAEPSSKVYVCSACGAKFDKALKFCGECGKPMGAASA